MVEVVNKIQPGGRKIQNLLSELLLQQMGLLPSHRRSLHPIKKKGTSTAKFEKTKKKAKVASSASKSTSTTTPQIQIIPEEDTNEVLQYGLRSGKGPMDYPSSGLSPIRESDRDESEGEDTEEDQATETFEEDTEGFLIDMPPPETFDYEDFTRPVTQGMEHQIDIVQPLGQPSSIAHVSSHHETHEHPIQSQGTEGETIPPLPSTQGIKFLGGPQILGT